jgi:hypothetical protein
MTIVGKLAQDGARLQPIVIHELVWRAHEMGQNRQGHTVLDQVGFRTPLRACKTANDSRLAVPVQIRTPKQKLP